MTSTRVLLADDQALLRAGFRVLIESADDLEVVGEAATGQAALDRVRAGGVDVVLMDIRMPEMDGLAATRAIMADPALAGVKVLILTTFEVDEYVFQALRAGASGFLGKGVGPDELLDAIRLVARGDSLLSPLATRALITTFLDRPQPVGRGVAGSAAGADPSRARGPLAGRDGAVQRRIGPASGAQPADRQDPRQPGDDQTRRPRPGAAGRHRLRERFDAAATGNFLA